MIMSTKLNISKLSCQKKIICIICYICSLLILQSISIDATATEIGYGPSILRGLSITVEDREKKGHYTKISVTMDQTGRLERVCVGKRCADIGDRFPIVRKIKEIDASRIGVLNGIMDETFGKTRLLLPFLDYQSVGCRVREDFKDENFIVLTFSKTGDLSSLMIICDLDVPFNYVQK
ncbi:MAG: hypothetical protein D6694_07845 [Gammaproteobacteria bacterium]|nr:MAG: hypothetical protein D6694_07845 [Gammaproteobacteria bacterium]